jgi:hypothetical protein
MKISVILLLLVLPVSILSPFCIHINLAHNDTPVILKLNVCNTADTPLSGGTNLPCLYETGVNALRADLFGKFETPHKIFTDLVIIFQGKKPPRV